MEEHKIDYAVILAGGKGERLKPLTDDTPKPLLLIQGKPILEYAIENLRNYGIKKIVLALGYKADKIMGYFGDGSKLGVEISYSLEDTPLGTGGAIKKASSLPGRFVALNGDNLANFNYDKMLEAHLESTKKLTLTLFPVEDVTQFGIAQLDGNNIIRFIEKPSVEEAPSNLNNAGAYIIEEGMLDMLPEGKSSIERDCFELLAPKGEINSYIHDGQWFPTDNLERFNLANERWKGI